MADGSFLSRAAQAVRYTLSGVTPDTWMSPQQPLPPQAQQTQGRQYDYSAGYNINYLPRADRAVKFPRLKLLAESCGVLRTVIERQKDLLESFDWNIKARANQSGKPKESQEDPAIQEIEAFFRYPDRIHDWAQWLRALLDQVFVYDALTIYRHRDMAGRPFAFELMDGSRFRMLIDGSGRRPFPPDPAYQQVLKGVVTSDYTTDELIYWPKNVRSDNPYGYPPVEQILDYVETFIERVRSQKSYFTEGNLIDGIFSGPVEWKADQIKSWQGYWDSLFGGNVAMRRKGFWVPNGTTFKEIKQPPLKDEFDEWLARVVCFAFSTSPQPFIKQVARGNQESQQEVAEEGGVATYMAFIKRVMDRMLAEDFQRPDLEFGWIEDREFDPMVAAAIDDLRLRNGSKLIDEVRARNGEDPLPNGQGQVPLVYTPAAGAVTLDSILNPPEPLPPVVAPAAVAPPGDDDPSGKKPPPTDKLAKRDAAKAQAPSAGRPSAVSAKRRLTKALTPILAKAGEHVADEIKTRLMAMGKAADDGGDALKRALEISKAVNLQTLLALEEAIQDASADIASESGALVVANVGAADIDGITDQVFDRAVAWAKAHAADLVSADGNGSLIASTRNMLRDQIAAGLEDNLGAAKIADLIGTSPAFSGDRAELIANTEIGNANSQGSLAGLRTARDAGVKVQKSWAVSGADCCDECQDNEDAGAIELDDDFPSGDDAPLAHPRCECVLVPEVADDD